MKILTETALELLSLLRLRAAVHYFPVSSAFGILKYRPDETLPDIFATDGIFLYFHPRKLCLAYKQSPDFVFHVWCHLHMHCLCLHIIYPPDCDRKLWNLACDIFAEQLLENPEALKLSGHALWTSDIYRFLKNQTVSVLSRLALQFHADSHLHWRALSKNNIDDTQKLSDLWSTVGKRNPQVFSNGKGHAGDKGGHLLAKTNVSHDRKCYDYRKFLTAFMTSREEILLDTDSFDYIPYLYGLSRYRNMPFIEPLEYREVNRLDEIAIAIDTSGSCPVYIVRKFLEETLSILEQKGNFFRKMRVHFIQCDSMIQDYRIFTCKEDWQAYMSNVRILGQGNTDFCPVFTLLNQKIKSREIKNLRALLYFTDGDGIYPSRQPDFETAFIFLNRELEKRAIPNWAIRLNLELSEKIDSNEENEHEYKTGKR